MQKLMIALCGGLMVASTFGVTCKLKTATTVDVLDDAGNVVETKRLKGGTKIEVADEGDAQKASSDHRLAPSGVSVQTFRKTQPTKGATFRAKISPMTHAYCSYFEGKEKSILGYSVAVCDDKGDFVSSFDGYVQKNSKIGKELRLKLKDGDEKLVYIKVKPIKQSSDDDVVSIDDIEFL